MGINPVLSALGVGAPLIRYEQGRPEGLIESAYLIAGLQVRACTLTAAVRAVLMAGAGDPPARFHFCSAHTIVEAATDARFKRILNNAEYVLPDGMPVAWFGWRLGYRVERVSGPDVMLAALDAGRRYGARHYFLGGTDGVAARLVASIVRRFPGITIAGYETPPVLSPDAPRVEETIQRINAARPTHVWVGLSSPKQDFWIANHFQGLHCGAVLGVGAAFDFHAGTRRRAPRWMQKSGTEWFYRLLSEPRRLGRRYTVTNSRFVAIVAHELASRAMRPETKHAERPLDSGHAVIRRPAATSELPLSSDAGARQKEM